MPLNGEFTMFFGKLLPRDGNFFALFNQHADCVVKAAEAELKKIYV